MIDLMALSIWQPHAALVAAGIKRFETRTWRTSYRGLLAIHAAAAARWRPDTVPELEDLTMMHLGAELRSLPAGGYVAVAELTACIPTEDLRPGPEQAQLANFRPGRFAWGIGKVWRLPEMLPAPGRQRLWRPSQEESERILQAAGFTPAINPTGATA